MGQEVKFPTYYTK